VVGVSLGNKEDGGEIERLLDDLAERRAAPVLPVWYEPAPASARKRRRRIFVLGGRVLPAGISVEDVRHELRRVAEEFRQRTAGGEPLQHADDVGICLPDRFQRADAHGGKSGQ
jgi:hypothetical protein